MFAISGQIQIGFLPFITSSYPYESSASGREDVLDGGQSELAAVTSLERALWLGNGGISIEDFMSVLFLLLLSASLKLVQVLCPPQP